MASFSIALNGSGDNDASLSRARAWCRYHQSWWPWKLPQCHRESADRWAAMQYASSVNHGASWWNIWQHSKGRQTAGLIGWRLGDGRGLYHLHRCVSGHGPFRRRWRWFTEAGADFRKGGKLARIQFLRRDRWQGWIIQWHGKVEKAGVAKDREVSNLFPFGFPHASSMILLGSMHKALAFLHHHLFSAFEWNHLARMYACTLNIMYMHNSLHQPLIRLLSDIVPRSHSLSSAASPALFLEYPALHNPSLYTHAWRLARTYLSASNTFKS